MATKDTEFSRLSLREDALLRAYDHVVARAPDDHLRVMLEALHHAHARAAHRLHETFLERSQAADPFVARLHDEEELVTGSHEFSDALRRLKLMEIAIAGEYEAAWFASRSADWRRVVQVARQQEMRNLESLEEAIRDAEGVIEPAGSADATVGEVAPPVVPSHLPVSERERALADLIRRDNPGADSTRRG
jgi:hypothetical protein